MTLTIAEPPVSGIITYPNGLKVLRLTDYMGGARATLSSIVDTDSPAGECVYEEQTLPIATTSASRHTSVSNTLTIPVADLDFGDENFYHVFLSMRTEGRPPIGGRQNETWNYHSNGVGPTVAWLRDTTLLGIPSSMPRSVYAHYSLVFVGSAAGPLTGTNWNFRAWGIDGGSMAFRFDLLYLVPLSLLDTDSAWLINAGDFPPAEFFTAETFDPDLDNATNNPIGKFSVRYSLTDALFGGVVANFDYQDDNDEVTVYDFRELFTGQPAVEALPSYIILVGAGSRLVNYHEIVNEDFATAPGGTAVWEGADGYMFHGAFNNLPGIIGADTGWEFNPNTMQFEYSGDPGGPTFPINQTTWAHWTVGGLRERSGFSLTDPSTWAPTLWGIESFLMQATVQHEDVAVGAPAHFVFGAQRHTSVTSQILYAWCGAVVTQETDDSFTLSLAANNNVLLADDLYLPDTLFGDAPVALTGFGTGDDYFIKVEKRAYFWRAKAWLTTDVEPDWMIEGYEPAWIPGATPKDIQYPYDDNWPAAGGNTSWDPVNQDPGGSITGYVPGGHLSFETGWNGALWRLHMDDVILEYEPDVEGTGDYTGANVSMEKWDEGEQWGTVNLDPGSHRVLYTGYENHHYEIVGGVDTHGGSVRAWRDSGAHPLQTAHIGPMYVRRFTRRRPQIYRRTYG